LNRVGKGELLAGHAADETPAANLTACFETPVHPCQLAPRDLRGFPREQAPEHHAVPVQQCPGETLDGVGA
jgi:hypothetical protein